MPSESNPSASNDTAPSPHAQPARYFVRFNLFERVLHGVLMASFLGLAATGMPLRFNQTGWAERFSHFLGGFAAIRAFHLTFAVVMTLCFAAHVASLFRLVFIQKQRGVFWGPSSLIPQPRDFRDVYQQFRWFFGRGPKPSFGRFTYWEKFDYWAVFWGMAIIGGSGFVMWFSTFFAHFLPGWLFNFALLLHADEALLAVWFVFTIHFFNSHLRPEVFPMDLVMLTGKVSEETLRQSRPLEHQALAEQGGFPSADVPPPPSWLKTFGRASGFSVIALGLFLLGLTLWSFLKE